ncbi:hypothetical protein NQ318_018783 [Aromia moschata]|uniref:Uncharacterized protein n=1 Tax=Aromia moschata TaxID=1265417 RepID=A0AAV8ZG80_9CUCU|nr:hypothetical protein NQ318_018783 [Aromia moschata]
MVERTPKKDSNQHNTSFSPVTLSRSPASSQINLTGSPRVVRDLVANLYNNIQHWNDSHIKGAQIVKNIAVLKSDNPKCYSSQLEEHTSNLYQVVKDLQMLKNSFDSFKGQVNALKKLKNPEILFVSLDIDSIVDMVETIANAYLKEFETKTTVLENIAHCKNDDEAMFFAACWTMQPCVTSVINLKLEALLVETGHRNFN